MHVGRRNPDRHLLDTTRSTLVGGGGHQETSIRHHRQVASDLLEGGADFRFEMVSAVVSFG